MKLVVAEKPAVARDLARVLGASRASKGALVGHGWTITWCIGHLVELEEPEAYDAAWKRWSFATLPMLPPSFRLRPAKRTLAQWRIVRDLMRRRDFESVVNACDAGREGELIFRYVYARSSCRLPIERLWISSLTEPAIRTGFATLRPGSAYDGLAAAARCRSEADWLVGLNATRAMTLATSREGVHSIGRVQTPTLALVVDRELEIRRFEPRPFWELAARVSDTFTTKWRAPGGATRLADAALAQTLEARVRAALPLTVVDIQEKETRERPPQLFDLTSLQRTANVRLGFSADRTLTTLQSLYERHKAITYPRTSSRYLSADQEPTLAGLVASFADHPRLAAHAARLGAQPLRITSRIVDDAKVTDHHAIIPTGKLPALAGDEARVFELVARRFLAAFHPDARFHTTQIVLATSEGAPRPGRTNDAILEELPPPPDHFPTFGRVVVEAGWHAVEPPRAGTEQALPRVRVGERLPAELSILEGTTRPPPRYTEASLLGAMETAGRHIEDEALFEAMKDCGLGTPATRAAIIETLIVREYIQREKKALVACDKGVELIERLPVPTLRSAELTGTWEARLARVAEGRHPAEAFMADVRALVTETVALMKGAASESPSPSLELRPALGACPRCRANVVRARHSFECSACRFRVPQRLAGRELRSAEVGELLRRGRTAVLSGFVSKKKRRFRAALVLEGGEVALSFPGGKGASVPGGAPSARRAAAVHGDADLSGVRCPACERAGLVAGRRAWGCAHWREGCAFVVPYVIEGKKLTPKELTDLLTRGVTRKATFSPGKGRLCLEGTRVELRLDP